MNDKVFLDPNVIDFLQKRGHRFTDVVERLTGEARLITDVKALQEVVYRYHLIGETRIGYEHAMALRNQVEIIDVTARELDVQEELLARYPNVRPRELLHVAVMLEHGIEAIVCSPESSYREVEDIRVEHMLSRIASL